MASQRRIELGSGPVADEAPGFGLEALDDRLSRLFWGDNVVWFVDAPASEGGFSAAVMAAAETVPVYRDVRVVAPGLVEAEDLDELPDRTLLAVDLRGPGAEFDVLPLLRHVFEREIICFWFLDAASDPTWLAYAQCVIVTEGPNLRIDRADGRPLGVRGVLLPFVLERDADDRRPQLSVRRAPAGALLGRGLRHLRRERGWSQAELGALIGVSGSAISQAERGLLSLSLESVLELSGRLGVPVDTLLRGPAESYTLARHSISDVDVYAQPWDTEGAPGSSLRTVTLTVPYRATASAGFAGTSSQVLLVARGLVQALLPDASPLLRAGDRLSVTGAELRGVRNVGEGEALLFWIAVAS